MQLLLALLPFAPVLLYLWLAIAFFVAYRRTSSREWRLQVLMVTLYALYWIITIVSPFLQKTPTPWWFWLVYVVYAFYPSLMLVRLPKPKNPQFVYRNCSDFVLMRQPTAVLPVGTELINAPQRSARTGLTLFLVSNLVLALVSVGGIESGTCRHLDVFLQRSGCIDEFQYEASIQSLDFSPDGSMLAVDGFGKATELWQLSKQTLIRTLPHEKWVNSVAFSPDGKVVATGSSDDHVRLWSVGDGVLIRAFDVPVPVDLIESVSFSPDGQFVIAVIGRELGGNYILIWRASDGSVLRTMPIEGVKIAFSPDSTLLATGGKQARIVLSRLSNGTVVRTFAGARVAMQDLAFSPDGSLLAGVSGESTLWLWRVSDGMLQRTITPPTVAHSLSFSSDGTLLATGGDEGMVDLWRVADRAHVSRWQASDSTISKVVFAPRQQILATTSGWRPVRLWQVQPR